VLICVNRINIGPNTVLVNPAMMTYTAIMAGTPPIEDDIFIAIGVVIERGTKLLIREGLSFIHVSKG
jgi:hypothetical protein